MKSISMVYHKAEHEKGFKQRLEEYNEHRISMQVLENHYFVIIQLLSDEKVNKIYTKFNELKYEMLKINDDQLYL